MAKDRVHLERLDKNPKLPVGPTALKPGPTLLIQVATAENVV